MHKKSLHESLPNQSITFIIHQAFPPRSPLVSYISRAILNVTQDISKMDEIERRYFHNDSLCPAQDPTTLSYSHNLSLSVYSFGGLFIITGVVSISAVLIYVALFLYSHWPKSSSIDGHSDDRSFWSKFVETTKKFNQVRVLSAATSSQLEKSTSVVVPIRDLPTSSDASTSVIVSPMCEIEPTADHAEDGRPCCN